MAMLREIKIINELFENSISKNKIETNHSGVEAFKTNFFENNFFSQKLDSETFIEINGDETVNISGCGIVNILVI